MKPDVGNYQPINYQLSKLNTLDALNFSPD